MKFLAVFIFLFSAQAFSLNSSDKAIAIEQFWKRFETATIFSFTVVDNYRQTLPEGSPIRTILGDKKNFKLVQIFVKSEFVTFVDTNFQTKEIRYLASVYKNNTFRKFNDTLSGLTQAQDMNPKIQRHIEANLLSK